MEAARTPSPREQLELSILEGQQEELTPLNSLQIQPSSAERSSPAQTDKESPWSPCNKIVVGRCKLWMVIVTIFVCFAIVIIISLCLIGVTYIDEDENEIPELSSNKTFFIMFKIPEECVNEEELHHSLTKRLMDTYKESPSLSRYFTSADIVDFSAENATVTYHLQFGVPAEDDGFMEYMMSEELVLGIMRQNLHDKNISSCESLGLDPESLLLYGGGGWSVSESSALQSQSEENAETYPAVARRRRWSSHRFCTDRKSGSISRISESCS